MKKDYNKLNAGKRVEFFSSVTDPFYKGLKRGDLGTIIHHDGKKISVKWDNGADYRLDVQDIFRVYYDEESAPGSKLSTWQKIIKRFTN